MTEQEKRQAHVAQEELDAVEQQAEAMESESNEASGTGAADAEAVNTAEAALERQLEEQRRLADENYQRYLRTQADFDNFRRRSRQEKEEFAKYAAAKLIEELLPVIDNFDRALAVSKDNRDFDGLYKGVDMIYRQMDQVLVQEGLQPIESVGKPFNPEYHQAVMQVQSDEYEEGIVVEELQKGYMIKDKVLRVAMVKVSG